MIVIVIVTWIMVSFFDFHILFSLLFNGLSVLISILIYIRSLFVIKNRDGLDMLAYSMQIESRNIYNKPKLYLLKVNQLKDVISGILTIKSDNIEICNAIQTQSGLKILFKMYYNKSLKENQVLMDDDISFQKTRNKLETIIHLEWQLDERPKILNMLPLTQTEALNEMQRSNQGSILTHSLKNIHKHLNNLDSIDIQTKTQPKSVQPNMDTINESEYNQESNNNELNPQRKFSYHKQNVPSSSNVHELNDDDDNLQIPKQDSGYDHARYLTCIYILIYILIYIQYLNHFNMHYLLDILNMKERHKI